MTKRIEYRVSVTEDDEETSLDVLEWLTHPPRYAGYYFVNFFQATGGFVSLIKYPLTGDEPLNATHWLGPLPEPPVIK